MENFIAPRKTEIKKTRAWFTGYTNPTGTTDSASSIPA